MNEIVRFCFPSESTHEEIEADVCLAVFTSECIYGRPKTRMAVSYLVDDRGEQCVLRVQGEAGESALQVFIGLCSERFGEDRFVIERLPDRAEAKQ